MAQNPGNEKKKFISQLDSESTEARWSRSSIKN